MRTFGQRKTFIDVMENVFEGVHISIDGDRDERRDDYRTRAERGCLRGFTVAAVEVEHASGRRGSRDDAKR